MNLSRLTSTQPATTKQSILVCLRKQPQATAQDLAEQLQISPQAIRRHLKDLEAEGLITFTSVQAGMGRPQHWYSLSSTGRDQFPESYDEFALNLLNTLAETVGIDQMSSILQKQWERKALEYRQKLGSGSLQDRIKTLVELRRAEGYMAEYHPYHRADPPETPPTNHYVLTEHNCAIAHIAQSFPSVCGHELDMFAVALPDCQVDRINWLVEGKPHCGYLIALRP
jgi:DeoR family suf operon transcriptional repressor